MTGTLRPPTGTAEHQSDYDATSAASMPSAPPGQHETQAVLDVLGPQPIEVDELARATGLPIRTIRTIRVILLECDLNGLIDRHGS